MAPLSSDALLDQGHWHTFALVPSEIKIHSYKGLKETVGSFALCTMLTVGFNS